MQAMRFILIGGFLGAGKTTTIAALARNFQQQGLKVGIVTNDQATDLVDTHSLRSQGHLVGEVAGACFCCNFNELLSTVEGLREAALPDVVLAEPVGSCTDIVATVIQPLAQLHQGRFDIAPYAVIVKPSHGLRILRRGERSGFSPKAAYIFRKQLEEADFVLINRVDELSGEQADELSALVAAEFPTTPQLRISAKSGQGIPALVEILNQRGAFGRRILQLDYDIYAAGEAELGWLNASLTIAAAEPLALDDLLLGIIRRLADRLKALDAEAAHLKVIGLVDGAFGVANLVSSQSPPELSQPSHTRSRTADLIVNARVALDPQQLDDEVRATVAAACAAAGADDILERSAKLPAGTPGADASPFGRRIECKRSAPADPLPDRFRMSIRLSNIRTSIDEPEPLLAERAARILSLEPDDIRRWRILRKSLDLRDKSDAAYVYSIEISVPDDEAALVKRMARRTGSIVADLFTEPPFEMPLPGSEPLAERPVIVGSGPGGAFAAYFLAEQGYRPIVLERGRGVRERIADMRAFDAGGPHNPESNYLFGEGGAGTFSDGKLTSRASGADVRRVLALFADCKGKPSVVYDQRPHLGSNRLPAVVKELRRRIVELGGEFRFDCRLDDVELADGQVRGVVTSSGTFPASVLVLAIGHSAATRTKCCFAAACRWNPSRFKSASASSSRKNR